MLQLDRLPLEEVVGIDRQGLEYGTLNLDEPFPGSLLGGAVEMLAGCLLAPQQNVPVGLFQGGGDPAAQEVAHHIMHPALFHFPLVLRGAGPAGGDQEAEVAGTLGVGHGHNGVIPEGPHDGCLEIVDDQPLGNPGEELEGVVVKSQPGAERLVEDELHEGQAAPGQDHDESPGPAQGALGILHQSGVTEVGLGLFPRLALDPYSDIRGDRMEVADETAQGGVAASEASFFQALIDGHHLGILGQQILDRLLEGLSQEAVLGWDLEGEGRIEERLQFLQGWKGVIHLKETFVPWPSPGNGEQCGG